MSKRKVKKELWQEEQKQKNELTAKTKNSLVCCNVNQGCKNCQYVKEPFCKTYLIRDCNEVVFNFEFKMIRLKECIAHFVRESSDVCSVCDNYKPIKKGGEIMQCKHFNKSGNSACIEGVINYFLKRE